MIEGAVPSLYESIKRIVVNVLFTLHLSDYCHGKVTKVNPLNINITSQHVLTESFLQLTNAVSDHDVDITVSWTTVENEHKHGNGNQGQDTLPSTHNHNIQGRKKITIHNGLTVGEEVLLLRKQGGQSYIVLDRINPIKTSGESV